MELTTQQIVKTTRNKQICCIKRFRDLGIKELEMENIFITAMHK